MKTIQNLQGAPSGSVNEAPKTGSFYNRVVELGSPTNIGVAVAAIAAYMMNAPILVIGLGVGGVLLCKRLFAVDPFTVKLEKIKSSNDNTERISVLDELIKDFDNVSAEKQVSIIKAMTSMLDLDIEKRIKEFINADKFNDANKFQAYVDGCVAFFEKLAKDDTEKDKANFLAGEIYQLQRFLVEKKAAAIETNKQTIDRSKLHQSLDNLILGNSSVKEWVKEIKQSLPLSAEEQLVYDFKNMESRNTETRYAALSGLLKAYETAGDKQVKIITAIIAMLKDNTNSKNGYQALGQIQLFILGGKINDVAKLQAVVDGFANYLKNPGEINYTSLFQNNDNSRILYGMVNTILSQFINHCMAEIKGQKIDLTQLKQSLVDLNNSIPSNNTTTSIKNKIEEIQAELI